MKTIPLTPEDDIVSICDHLDWARDQQVIFVLPETGGVLREGLDLVRLLRHADDVRAEIALVTAVTDISRQANALGIPTFTTIGLARKSWQSRRRRRRKRREMVGLSALGVANGDERFVDWHGRTQEYGRVRLDLADQTEAHKRLSPHSQRRRWLWRYAAIFLFCLTAALLVVAFFYLLPGATVTLKPELLPVQVARPITADPSATAIDFQNGILPARLLQTTQNWQAEVQTTGTVELPEATARGKVVFANLLDQEVTIPAGTRVSTSDGSNRVYQVNTDVILPAAVGSTAEVEVTAVTPGPDGNVDANLVNRVEGALAVQVQVRNLEPIEGGGVRAAPAVTEEDRVRLRAQVMQFLRAVAASEMEVQLTPGEFLTPDSVRVVNVLDETYSHEVGEQTSRLTLSMRVEMAGTAVDTTTASDLAYYALGQEIEPGFALVPESIRFESGDITGVDEAGRVNFSMIAAGMLARNLQASEAMAQVTGQDVDTAVAFLDAQLPLREPPFIHVWPVWFDRIPYLSTRITTDIQTGVHIDEDDSTPR